MQKKIQLSLICLFLFQFILTQAQDQDSWIVPEFAYTSEVMRNFRGGISSGNAYQGMAQIGLTLDTRKMKLWRNGEFFLHGALTHGNTPSADLIGDLQVVSNIEAGFYPAFFEFWYRHQVGKNLTLLFGQHDLNSEFVVCEAAGLFVNSAFGIHSSVSLNVPVSIFPVGALGMMMDYQVLEHVKIKMGFYDGDPGDTESNNYNLQISLNPDQGMFGIGELTFNAGERTPMEFKTGVYIHTGNFPAIENEEEVFNGNYGFYALADQRLWNSKSENSTRSMNAFVQTGWGPDDRNINHFYLGAGITLQDLLGKNQTDLIGISLARASFCPPYVQQITDNVENSGSETSFELTWQVLVFPYLVIQPDLQYVMNPGVSYRPNALVGIFRTYWTFL